MWVFEVGLVVVGGQCVLISLVFIFQYEAVDMYHVKCGARRNNCLFEFDILYAHSWQRYRNHCEKPQNFSYQCRYIPDFLFDETFRPGVAIWIYSHDLIVRYLLNLLAMGGGKVGESHDQVARDGVEASGYHG
jgi:hypothetical protein